MATQSLQLDPTAEYKERYGFFVPEDYIFKAKRGLSEAVVKEISYMKSEPDWMAQRRLKALAIFHKKPLPTWGADLSVIDFDNIYYFLRATDRQSKTWEELPAGIKETYERLGVPEAERKFLAGVSAQYECLAKGASVWTERGEKAIENITIADKVWAYDEEKRSVVLCRVLGIKAKGIQDVYRVETTSRVLECTNNHPFLYTNRTREGKLEWRYLSDLRVGDYVVTARKRPDDGEPRIAVSTGLPAELGTEKIRKVEWNGLAQTYDIEVEGVRNYIANGVLVHNSEVVYHSLKKDLEAKGVIFCDMDTALREHEDLVKEYFGTIIPAADNKFAALNTATWSGGSFVYVPEGVKVDVPLQAYFRINAENMGQFERTLIICEPGSSVSYVEGCLLPDAMVRVVDGEKPIKEIKVGDRVLTHRGRWREVLATQKRRHRGDLVTIKFMGEAYRQLRVTPQHPFLVGRQEASGGIKQVWLEAHELKDGDLLAVPVIREVAERRQKELASQVVIGQRWHPTVEDVHVKLDVSTCWTIGLYLAEGSVSANTSYVYFDSHIKEVDIRADTRSMMLATFGLQPWEVSYKDRAGISLGYSSVRAARWFVDQFGRLTEAKKLPDWVFDLPTAQRAAIVRGFYAGEGSWDASRDYYRISQTNRGLGQRMRELLLSLGIRSSLSQSVRPAPRLPLWQLAVASRDNSRFEELVLQVNPLPRAKTRHDTKSWGDVVDGFMWVPISSISSLPVDATVYNLKVAEDESYVAEGVVSHNCTAPIYSTDSLHSAVVEIIVKKGAYCRYTTIQNWSTNVFNLVTKRAAVYADAKMDWLDSNTGSQVTMKYPSCYLMEPGAKGEVLSVAFAGKGQHLDAGGKMVHVAPHTTGIITSKSISKSGGRTSYRGHIKIYPGAHHCKSFVKCDALLLDDGSRSDTYPYMDIEGEDVTMGHEATVSKVSDEQLFYLMSRGINRSEAEIMIINGFIEPLTKELPMEYAVEMNRLIQLEMTGSVG